MERVVPSTQKNLEGLVSVQRLRTASSFYSSVRSRNTAVLIYTGPTGYWSQPKWRRCSCFSFIKMIASFSHTSYFWMLKLLVMQKWNQWPGGLSLFPDQFVRECKLAAVFMATSDFGVVWLSVNMDWNLVLTQPTYPLHYDTRGRGTRCNFFVFLLGNIAYFVHQNLMKVLNFTAFLLLLVINR